MIHRQDENTRTLMTIDYAHHEIHDGSAFLLANVVTIPAANEYEIYLLTPDSTKQIHLILTASCDAVFTATLFESTAKTWVQANVLTPYNLNRNSSKEPTVAVCHTPAGAGADGTQLAKHAAGVSGSPVTASGGAAELRAEIILKYNTAYLINFTAVQNDILSYDFDWYEHTSKEE